MFKKMMVMIGIAVFVSSCANKLHRGVVAMKINDSTAHVGLAKNEVTVGDHVELYGNKCNRNTKIDPEQACQKISKGHGLVSGYINDNYVAVTFDKGVTFEEGDFIEKHSH